MMQLLTSRVRRRCAKVSPGARGPAARLLMSAPAEKILPRPGRTTQRASGRSLISSKHWMSCSTKSLVWALTGGASMVTIAILSAISRLINCSIFVSCSGFLLWIRRLFGLQEQPPHGVGIAEHGPEIDGAFQIQADVAFVGITHR